MAGHQAHAREPRAAAVRMRMRVRVTGQTGTRPSTPRQQAGWGPARPPPALPWILACALDTIPAAASESSFGWPCGARASSRARLRVHSGPQHACTLRPQRMQVADPPCAQKHPSFTVPVLTVCALSCACGRNDAARFEKPRGARSTSGRGRGRRVPAHRHRVRRGPKRARVRRAHHAYCRTGACPPHHASLALRATHPGKAEAARATPRVRAPRRAPRALA